MAYDVDPIELLDSVVEYSAFKFPQSAHRFVINGVAFTMWDWC